MLPHSMQALHMTQSKAVLARLIGRCLCIVDCAVLWLHQLRTTEACSQTFDRESIPGQDAFRT